MLSFCDLNNLFYLYFLKQNYFALNSYTIRIEIGGWFIDENGDFADKRNRGGTIRFGN